MEELVHFVEHAVEHLIQHPGDLTWVLYIFLGVFGLILMVMVLAGVFGGLSYLGDRIFPAVNRKLNDPKRRRQNEKVYAFITITLILLIAIFVYLLRRRISQ